jgi:hypothetical protein
MSALPLRHLDPECPRRLQVDGELELGRLQHWQVGGLHAFENLTGIDADLARNISTEPDDQSALNLKKAKTTIFNRIQP